ncbi:MAG: hypothetical protein ACOYL6_16180 [Bacteriovoracaceae bacterium]
MKKIIIGALLLTSASAFAECNLSDVVKLVESRGQSSVTHKKINVSTNNFKFQSSEHWSNTDGGVAKFLWTRKIEEKTFYCTPGEDCFPNIVGYEADYLVSMTFDADCKAQDDLTTSEKISEREY